MFCGMATAVVRFVVVLVKSRNVKQLRAASLVSVAGCRRGLLLVFCKPCSLLSMLIMC